MCERQEYQLLIDDNLNGQKLEFGKFPELDITYIKNENNLCPSYYSKANCIQNGNLSITLKINDHIITLKSDMKNDMIIDNYKFRGLKALVKNKSKKETYIVFSIEKCENKNVYNLYQPFILEFHDNPSTGYSWKLELPEGIKMIKESHSNRCQEGITGCGGMRTFVLEGIKKGEQKIIAINGRPWDPSTNTKYEYLYQIV